MADLISQDILDYCDAHTSPDSPVGREIADETYAKTTNPGMLVGKVQGMFLTLLARSTGAKRVLEIGTFTGYSALRLAEGLPDDGEVTTCDINHETTAIAKRHWRQSPHGKKITLALGPALDTIESLPGPFDLIFIDADKGNYINYWEACLPKLRTGGLVLVDNVLWSGRVLAPEKKDDHAIVAFNTHIMTDPRVELVMLTVRDGITMACKR